MNHQTITEQIQEMPGQVLFSLARNESASPEFRKAATEILLDRGFPQAHHPELVLIVHDIRKEREARHEVEAIVESAIEGEIPVAATVPAPSPFRASVTTASMQLDTIVQNSDALSDDALTGSE